MSLGDKLCVGLNMSVSKAFCAGFPRPQFHANASIDGSILPVLEGCTLDDGNSLTKGEDVVDPPADPVVIELPLVFFFQAPLRKLLFLFYLLFFIVVWSRL